MKIVHFTHNIVDGAGKAAYRLHKTLQREGLESLMLVCRKEDDDKSVVQVCDFRFIYSNFFQRIFWKLKLYLWKPSALFNFNIAYVSIRQIKKYLHDVDIICLYSTQNFLSPRLIKEIYKVSKAPIVWTLMDIEPLTGGCHFSNGCDAFTKSCGNCTQIAVHKENDISRKIWRKKQNNFKNIPITFVAVNSWGREHVARSSLFGHNRIENILLGADNKIFKKVDKEMAREKLDLPKNGKVILFGCFNLNDKRKGANYLKEALGVLPEYVTKDNKNLLDEVTLVTFGRRNGFDFNGIPFRWKHLGELKDDKSIASAYCAADIFACPSIDDLGPMMVNEAFMCEVPVVAFNSGVARDLIKFEEAGYTAQIGDINDFSRGMLKYLFRQKEIKASGETQRLRQMCSIDFQAQQYHLLFKDIISTEKA